MIEIFKKFIKLGLCTNYWLWFHLLSGALGTKLFLHYFTNEQAIIIVMIITILWELLEYMIDSFKKYASHEKWLYDSAGDILAVWLISIIIIWI